jgi:hypothetical protein
MDKTTASASTSTSGSGGRGKGIQVGSSSLPRPGQGYTGEFVGLMAEYHAHVQKKLAEVLSDFDNQPKYTT